ncbi:MAG: bifunctional adenosylcobinamide kinase/adenosylcobinamide-phosphate guanylyltransferase [Myxococcota bacterium]
MMESKITLVGGGVRSGKSRFALDLALKRGMRRTFIATAQAFDDEMRARIARHQTERAGLFDSVEAPIELTHAVSLLSDEVDVLVIDCLTLWLSNLLLRGDDEARIEEAVLKLMSALSSKPFDTVVVTNEVGLGVVPESALGRRFRDVSGRAHQRIAEKADQIYFAALGVILRLRPGPVEVADAGEPMSEIP